MRGEEVCDRGFLFGDGLFETVRVASGRVRWLERHVARLRRSGAALGFPGQMLEEAVAALEAVVDEEDGIWRVTVTRPGDGMDYGGTGMVSVRHRPVSELERPHLTTLSGYFFPEDETARHKTTSRMRYVEARRRGRLSGFDDVVLVCPTPQGVLVGEATASSLFVVFEDEVVTPLVEGLVAGVTRAGIVEGGQWAGLPVRERRVYADELDRCVELALVNAGGVVAAASLNGRPLGDEWTRGLDEELP
jgi:branched-chain amino acid aminotransferase